MMRIVVMLDLGASSSPAFVGRRLRSELPVGSPSEVTSLELNDRELILIELRTSRAARRKRTEDFARRFESCNAVGCMMENIALENDTSTLQRALETFEHELERLHGRIFDPDARSAILALRDSWHRVVEIAFGAVRRVRCCPSCRRSQLQTGPRCVFCWQRFKTHDMADGDGDLQHT